MKRHLLLAAAIVAAGCSNGPTGPSGQPVGFFVTSATSVTGNLGGLAGADASCERLASAAGFGARTTWRAYLSAERDSSNDNQPTHARDRIGKGPWYNVNGLLVANNLAELHARSGNAEVFVDERGQRINGQWSGSPSPIEHDILTGSNSNGTLAPGLTCADWTSNSTTIAAQIGHSDGFGGNQSTAGSVTSWNAAHTSQNCANTAPRGGAGRFYCFAR